MRTSVPRSVVAIAAIVAAFGLASCVQQPVPVSDPALAGTFFTRHSMRGVQDGQRKTIFRSCYLDHPDVLPAGSEAKIETYSTLWIDLGIDAIPCRLKSRDVRFLGGHDGIEKFLDKHFVRDRAALGLDALSEQNRDLILSGRAAIGMTKEEVILAIGYPAQIDGGTPADELPRDRILKSNQWTYRGTEIVFVPTSYIYQFGTDGKLVSRDPP